MTRQAQLIATYRNHLWLDQTLSMDLLTSGQATRTCIKDCPEASTKLLEDETGTQEEPSDRESHSLIE